MTRDDDDLVARLADDHGATRERAERELFERFHPQVERMLRRLLGPDCDDCVQEAFVDVFAGVARFEGRAKLSTWIYRVALRRGWKCLAARRRRSDREAPADVDAHAAATPPVDATLTRAELAERFERALDRLDDHQRTVLSLSAIDGLDPSAIAEVLGVPVGTVHSRLHRARERMRAWLGVDG